MQSHASQPTEDDTTATPRSTDADSPDLMQSESDSGGGTEAEAPSETDADMTGAAPDTGTTGQLVPQEAVMDFNARWEAIQRGFVDDPRSAVSDADGLVGDVLEKLSHTFEEQHQQLEGQWSDGEPDTEELRSSFQRYRDFFDRLLTI